MASLSITETVRRFWGGGSLPQVDLVLTDPPYGINAYSTGTMGGSVLAKQSTYAATSWDSSPPTREEIERVISAGTHAILFGGNYFHVPPSSCWLVWDKDNGLNYFADCELAWTNLPKAVRKLRHKWQGMLQEDMANKEQRFHPTQKPVQVMEWAINQCKDVRTILDPYMGSGTTLVAAKQLGRQCIGIEREEKYCEIAARRLSQGCLFSFDEAA